MDMDTTLTVDEIKALLEADVYDPFSILGIHLKEHLGNKVVAVRTFQPDADKLWIVGPGGSVPAKQIDPAGIFEAIYPDHHQIFPYQIKAEWKGISHLFHDPYRLPPVLSDYDLYLFNEGSHRQIYDRLGAQLMVLESIQGTLFSVWAPNARRVSVVGDFNHWDGRRHMMRVRGESGVWELFIPDLGKDQLYKFEILTQQKVITVRSDPLGFYFESRPKTAACIYNHDHYQWQDQKWIDKRDLFLKKPIAIYELHLGSWRKNFSTPGEQYLNYQEIADLLIPYVKDLGFNFIEFLPVAEHPLDDSWGYQVTGYFAPTSRFGDPDGFKHLVDELHQAGIGVILDWVPAHFPKDIFALARFDGTALYEHEDPRKGEHYDWGTMIFNYGRSEVKSFLISNAIYWLDKFHIDGLRVDAVASMLYLDYSRKQGEWIPNKYGGNENIEAIEFLKELNFSIYQKFPHTLMVAEESTSWPMVSRPTYLGGLGFSYKWNMGWMNDFLTFINKEPIHRKYHFNNLTFSLLYAFTENFILPISHDEVVHGKGSLISKMPGDYWQKFANTRLALGYMFAHPGKKLLFMGCEIGQWDEWNHQTSIQWHLLDYPAHKALHHFVRDLVKIYRNQPPLWDDDYSFRGFSWIDFHDTDSSVVSFIRWTEDHSQHLVIVANFTPVVRHNYRIGVPQQGIYEEILNSDSGSYFGSNVGNYGQVTAEPKPWHLQPNSMEITLPPLGIVYFKLKNYQNHEEDL